MNRTIKQDDRTADQRNTHTVGVVMRDRFMSGWGGATGGYSRAMWALDPAECDIDKLERWVSHRGDANYVNRVLVNNYRPSRSTVHLHVYVVGPDHPSQQ